MLEHGNRICVLAMIGCLALGTAAADSPVTPVVAGEVLERLETFERARVMILLSVPPGDPTRIDLLMQRVSEAQAAVLGVLAQEELVVKRRFQAVPALAGDISLSGLERLAALPGVLRVDLDEGGSGTLAEAVPLTNSDDVQALGFTGEGITVAILDSGLDTDHLDLGDDLVGEACFCSGGNGCCPGGSTTQFGAGAAEDDHGHGSNVTGIVTSAGVVAPVGVAPDAEIVGIKVLDSNNAFCCTSDIVAGLDWIIANRPDVDVVNMSLGTNAMYSGNCDNVTSFNQALAAAINTLRANGVLSFVSSGNNGSGTQMQSPACVANSISIGAVYDSDVGSVNIFGCNDPTTAADQVTCFTNSNSTTDLFAPGAPITSAWRSGSTSTFYGTSQASPHAAGCAANLLQADPTLDPATLETILETTGPLVTDVTNGLSFPRADCLAALDAVQCVDLDMDGAPASAGCPGGGAADCDDGDPDRFPGNPEVCDGSDNDCDGTVNNAVVPGTVGSLLVEPSDLAWDPETAATGYDVVRVDLGTLRTTAGDFAAAAEQCLADDRVETSLPYSDNPSAGQGFGFLVRGANCGGSGTYDVAPASQVGLRDPEVDASGVDCTSVVCGDGARELAEVCDGADLDDETCVSQGFDAGDLSCNPACDGFDTSQCTACGNSVREGTEVCDGADLNGETCQGQGFDSGTLACNGTCDAFDTSGCSFAQCGNTVCEPGGGEDCLSCQDDCNGVQNGNPSNRYCCGDGDGENPASCTDPRCTAGGNTCQQ